MQFADTHIMFFALLCCQRYTFGVFLFQYQKKITVHKISMFLSVFQIIGIQTFFSFFFNSRNEGLRRSFLHKIVPKKEKQIKVLISSGKVRPKIWPTLRNSYDQINFDIRFENYYYYFFFVKIVYNEIFFKVGFSQRIDSFQKAKVGASSLCLLSLESDSVFLSLSGTAQPGLST